MSVEKAGKLLPLHHTGGLACNTLLVSDGDFIDYTLRRSCRRRSISLLIDERGLCVMAPQYAPQSAIDDVLNGQREWIKRKLGDWQSRRPRTVIWGPGEHIMFQGHPLELAAGDVAAVRHEAGCLCYGPSHLNPAEIELRLRNWLRERALPYFIACCSRFSGQLGLPAPTVRLSDARRRWGSCQADGHIRMNWRLIQAPTSWIEYVAAHEVAHRVELNHSLAFWRTVAALLPDHAERRLALRREIHRYLLL